MLRVLVCVSGGGTNLQALIDSMESGAVKGAKIIRVISNNRNAYALERAAKHGIASECISPKDYDSREEFNRAFLQSVDPTQ